MLRVKAVLLLLVLVLAVAATAGCGGPKAQTRPAPEASSQTKTVPTGAETQAPQGSPTQEPAAATAPTAASQEASEGEELSFSDIKNLEKFKSYRLSNAVIMQEEKGTKSDIGFAFEFVADPPAQHMAITSLDKEGKKQVMEYIQIADVVYASFGGEWMAMTSTDDAKKQMGWLWDPGDFLTEGKGKFVGKETVNGIETKHYRYDHTAFRTVALLTDLKEGKADVWVSPEHNVYVKVIMHIVGNDPEKGQVTVDLESNVSDINKPIVIKAPEGVAKPGLPEDVPMVEGATEVSFVGTTGSYKTEMAADKVAEFYRTQMKAKGWTLEPNSSDELLAFSKGTRTATVMISTEGGTTQVSVFISEATEQPTLAAEEPSETLEPEPTEEPTPT